MVTPPAVATRAGLHLCGSASEGTDVIEQGQPAPDFELPDQNGEPVQVFVTYPPNFDPKKKWPLLHSIHGGPHAAHVDGWHFRWNSQVFAGQGYVVAGVNYHGSSGFGQRFIESMSLFSHLANVGDARSLVIHPASTTHFRMDAAALQSAGITEGTIRLSIGLEDPDDLIDDLKRGLKAAEKAMSGKGGQA